MRCSADLECLCYNRHRGAAGIHDRPVQVALQRSISIHDVPIPLAG